MRGGEREGQGVCRCVFVRKGTDDQKPEEDRRRPRSRNGQYEGFAAKSC